MKSKQTKGKIRALVHQECFEVWIVVFVREN